MIYLAIAGGVFLIALWFYVTWVYDTNERLDRKINDLRFKSQSLEQMLDACEKDKEKEKARIDARVDDLQKKFINYLHSEQTFAGKIDTANAAVVEDLRKFSREIEFMRAHQHGMDKRIAGLKREVMVTINYPPDVPPKKKTQVTKSLLKRAGVTQ